MLSFEDQENLSRLLRDMVWQSFEYRFSAPASLPGVYGVFLEAIDTTSKVAYGRMHAYTGRLYAHDELYLRNLSPCIRPVELMEAMQRPAACVDTMVGWELTELGTPFKVWFVHH